MKTQNSFKKTVEIVWCSARISRSHLTWNRFILRPLLHFLKLILPKSFAYVLWFVLIMLNHVLVIFSSVVHRLSFTTNHIYSY